MLSWLRWTGRWWRRGRWWWLVWSVWRTWWERPADNCYSAVPLSRVLSAAGLLFVISLLPDLNNIAVPLPAQVGPAGGSPSLIKPAEESSEESSEEIHISSYPGSVDHFPNHNIQQAALSGADLAYNHYKLTLFDLRKVSIGNLWEWHVNKKGDLDSIVL